MISPNKAQAQAQALVKDSERTDAADASESKMFSGFMVNLNNSDVLMQSNSNPSTPQIFSLGVSSFDPPKNPLDVQKIARTPHPPLMTAHAQGIGSGSSLAGSGGSSANAGAGAGANQLVDGSSWKGWEVASEMLEGLV